MKRTIFLTSCLIMSLIISGCGLKPTSSRVEGSVIWNGTSVTNSTVKLMWNEDGLVMRTHKANQETQIDQNGQFMFESVSPGYYAIEIMIDRTKDKCILGSTLELKADDKVNLNFIIPEGVEGFTTLPDFKGVLFCQ